jgi:DNA-binding transcriptional MocR family regulator
MDALQKDDLAACHDKVLRLYSAAYAWPAPLPPGERTLRQYIKGWITQWDLRRLDGSDVLLISGSIASDYTENAAMAEPGTLDEE